jgi:hypothetical protein
MLAEVNVNKLDVKSEYFFDLLQRMKQRPGMYLGKCSITRLRAFLDGYETDRAELGFAHTEQQQQLDGFQEWIQERYQITSTHGWDSIILFFSVDEKDALDKFFKVLEEFLYQAKIVEDKHNLV